MPARAYMYALPYEYYEKYQVRRYGFHGTSHRYVSDRLAELKGVPKKDMKIITCHLGNGCSITAIQDGVCIDTSMGFTPLDGFMMGTRTGTLDPSALTFIAEKENLSPADRPHESRRSRCQRRTACPQCCACRTKDRCQNSRNTHKRLEHEFQRRHHIHNIERICNDQRDQFSGLQTKDSADKAGCKCITDVFYTDRYIAETKRLHRTDLGTLLFDHSCHGCQTGQSCHQEENDREHVCQITDSLRILTVSCNSHIGFTTKHIPFTLIDVIQFCLCIC
ncbi:MAG: hypothetical protein II263_02170, partial [Lachnospiraceae bacterium]|nr:hypothetical protein [Lachnospiraceae bacterium]